MNTQENFRAYMPLTLSKSIDKNGKEILKMSGVMSSTSKDTDGQVLDPNGFNMEPIMTEGFMNWHHQSNKNPMAIIGKPTSYSLDKSRNEMNLDFELFAENPMAQQVYQLQQVLEGQGLSLGLSLEGTATQFRDPITKEYVEKADITGCAVTPSPKNKDAIVRLVKGMIESDFQLIKGDIISEGTGSEIGESKNPLIKESLSGAKKKRKKKEEGEEEFLTKSEVLDIVGKRFPDSTYETLENFFKFTLELEKSNKATIMKLETTKEGVSSSALQKALENLGLDEVKKVEVSEEVSTSEIRLDNLEKGMVEILNILKKGKETLPVDNEEEEEKEGEEEEEKGGEGKVKLKKALPTEDSNLLIKGLLERVENSLGDKMDAFNSSLEKANANFEKALDLNEALTSKLQKAEESLEAIDREVEELRGQSMGRRTVTTKSFLKKGLQDEEASLNVLSARGDKRLICDTLEKACMSDGRITDQQLANAVMQFEQSNVVTETLVKGLLKSGYTLGN